MLFCETLLTFRAQHNLTQAQLADILGVSTMTVCRMENSKTKPTKVGVIKYYNKMKEWEKNNNV